MGDIKKIIFQSDAGDCFWTSGGLIGLEELGCGDLTELEEECRSWSASIEPLYPEF